MCFSPLSFFYYFPQMFFFDVQVLGVDVDDPNAAAKLWMSFFDIYISMLEANCNL